MPVARLLSAGEAFEDLIFVGLDRLPGPGEELRTNQFLVTVGGGAVITAVAAARLGLPVTLASGLSDRAVARLRTEKIRVLNLRRRGEPHAVTAALSTSRDRAFVTFDGVNTRLEARLAPVLRSTRATHVHLALYPRHTARWARRVAALRRRGITVSWDFGWNDVLAQDAGLAPLLDALDVVFVNESEAALYAGADRLEDALPFWRARHRSTGSRRPELAEGRPIVVIKLGALGSRAILRDGEVAALAPKVVPVDTTGAGDAFNGGFLAAWLRGAALVDCLKAGNRMGAASTRKAGGLEALPPRRASARERMRASPRARSEASKRRARARARGSAGAKPPGQER